MDGSRIPSSPAPRRAWTRWDNVRLALRSDRGGIVALVLLALIVAACVLAPILPLDPDTTNTAIRLAAPSAAHWFGTDEIGRDYLSRVVYGGRVSLLVGMLAMLASMVIGVLVGMVAGYCGGLVDAVLMRLVDVLSSIPWLVLVTVVSIFLKAGLTSIILVIGLFTWMEIARLVRAETLSLKEREYVQYARFLGARTPGVIFSHLIPSSLPTIITAATTSLAGAIMTESSLSFLGVGVQQPMSSWGSLLQSAQGTLQTAPYMAFIPGLLIVVTIFGFNKLGDLMRIYADPRIMSDERG
jgi:peptide/nickel transport system permease protein